MHFDLHDPTFWVMIAFFGFIGLLYYYKVHKVVGKALDGRADAIRKEQPQSGWEIRTRDNASPQLERNITRFTQFLTLVGLASLLVGGVGVANAVKSHLDRRRDVIATFKAIGATGRGVFAIYLAQIVMLSVIGAAIGLALGAALPFAVVAAFESILPLPIEP